MFETGGLTLLSISLANLDETGTAQMELPFDGDDSSALDAALDDLRERFGADAVTRASLIDRDAGVSVPLLPD